MQTAIVFCVSMLSSTFLASSVEWIREKYHISREYSVQESRFRELNEG